jgi:hypothetical protein
MIPNIFIQNWSNHVKWQTPAQIEQDLIISRALVDLYNDPHIIGIIPKYLKAHDRIFMRKDVS